MRITKKILRKLYLKKKLSFSQIGIKLNCFIEIKGWWRDNAKQKVKRFLKLYPDINYKLYFKEDLQELGIIK
jgi:hypothetical protein